MDKLDKLKSILQNHFGLTVETIRVGVEQILRKKDPERFDRMAKSLKEKLPSHGNGVFANEKVYIDDEELIYLQKVIPEEVNAQIKDGSSFYYPYCTVDEIKRIEDPKNDSDLLLKIRADAIADDPRLIRIFISRYEKKKSGWSLTSHFNNFPITKYICKLPNKKFDRCRKIASGFAFIKEPNGICLKTKYGQIVLVSETLRYFLYYMNVALFTKIPNDDRHSALIIAIRIMLGRESLDFDLDSRGEIPVDIHEDINAQIEWQLQFIIGHEFAHFLENHLGSADLNTLDSKVLRASDSSFTDIKYYNLLRCAVIF